MKKVFTIFCFIIFIIHNVIAQSPEGFNYQALARDTNGNIVPNSNISIMISILSGSMTGNVEYQETHSVVTNLRGGFDIQIGYGNVAQGTFSNINWGGNSHYLNVDIDFNGGTNYLHVGTSQLLSVPYALYAKSAGSGGHSGSTGPSGSNGITGTRGSTGPTGISGLKGSTGLQGLKGSTGPTGSDGLNGATGLQGSTGFQGPTGNDGLKGDTGSTGVQGATGPSGTDGAQGVAGVQGMTGPSGSNGLNGATGAEGSTGPSGIDGHTGVTGAQGRTGVTGPTGDNLWEENANDIYYDNGTVSLGTGGSDPSAVLTLISTDKGFLMPRMTEAQRVGIASPASGLIVFQTDGTIGFYFFNGTEWKSLQANSSGSDNNTLIYTTNGF